MTLPIDPIALISSKSRVYRALFNAGGQFYAIDNSCRHRGGPLGEGDLMGTTVVCPWHGWEYNVTNGENIDDPSVKVACFAVRVDGDDILLEV